MNTTEAIARRVFSEIAASFPNLQIVEEDNPQVEISLTIPVQSGMKHAVWLALENTDELHLSVAHFWMEWFPCTKPEKVHQYIEAVKGFLSGRYRVIEHYYKGKCFKAQLQAPSSNDWETIATWSNFTLRFPWGSTASEVRNA